MAPAQVYNWEEIANVIIPGKEEEQKPGPLEKLYFNDSMLEKYEPCVDALQKLIDGNGEDEETWNTFETHFEKFLDFSWCSNWDGKKYDIVLYGVTGYTGYLTMQYMKRVSLKRNPEKFTFALAGRTLSKVQEVREREFGGTEYEDCTCLQAAYDDVISVIDMVKSARVVINVAGPYSLAQGEVLIDACCHLGVHYCDVSGELPWTVRTLELHENAKKSGAVISPSAAVAGGTTDLMVCYLAKKARHLYGEELRRAITYASGGGEGGGASGGTLASRGAMSSAPDDVRKKMADPFTLGGFVPDLDRNGIKNVIIEQGTGKCTPKIRKEEMDAILSKISVCPFTGVWRAPFVYAFFNTRIIRRSNAMLADLENRPYGRTFNYQEFAMLPEEAVQAIQAAKGLGAAVPAGPSVSGEKEALEAAGKYYKQGDGPKLEGLTDTWISFTMWAQTTSGKELRCSMVGSDGYFETARTAVEFAQTMLWDGDKVYHRGGVLNCAVACQEYMLKRVVGSGARFIDDRMFTKEENTPPGFEYPGRELTFPWW